jgi:Transcriptional regulator containing an amidase domain and an AraC-type DNA-binding HTH domain
MQYFIDTISGAFLQRSIFFLFFLAGSLVVTQADAQAIRYVCTPCGAPCDSKFFDKPGTCPACGLPLITEEEAKAAIAAAGSSKKVAILIFDGVQIIDFTGPYEVFGAAGFDVYTVAKTKDPITTTMGMTVIPKYSFDDAPQPDVLVVPGGGVKATQEDATTLKWIKDETARIEHTMSVCNGAFILAYAGLLDGLSATTTNGNIPRLREQFPKIKVVDDRRYVDNGKIITTAGLAAGIDGAMHVIELMMGKGHAEQVALYEEYDWSPRATFVRAALADQLIPDVDIGVEYGKWEIISTEGGTDHWQRVFRGTSNKSAMELMGRIEKVYSATGKWTKIKSGTDGTSKWRITGKDGKEWSGTVTIQETPGQGHEFLVKVKIAKVR